MSKRLGNVQQAVLATLHRCKHGSSVSDLVIRVFHPEFVNAAGEITWIPDYDMKDGRMVWMSNPFTRAEYVTVDRAVRTLEQRGLVRTEIRVPKRMFGHYMGPRWKLVELVSVDKVERLSTLTKGA